MALSTIVFEGIEGFAMPETDERVTPRWLIQELSKKWVFGLDAAATSANRIRVGIPYFGPDADLEYRDGLAASWAGYGTVWCNPPYSRGSILQWCAKATMEATQGVTTVMLLPGDTSTEYFHNFVLPNEHYFLQSRLKFEGAPLSANGKLSPAKFGSVIVVFQPELEIWTRG